MTVTARRAGYATVSRTSAARSVTQPFTGAPTPTVSAQLVRVGWVIRASSSVWSPTATLSVQWRRDGVTIPGATGWSYRMTTADLGKRMTATVTGRRASYTTTSRTSPSSAAVLAAPYGFTDTGAPSTPPAAPYAPSVIRVLTDAQWAKLTAAGVWRSTGCPGTRTTFRRVEVPYWGMDGKTHRGYVNVNADVARTTVKIFDALYAKRFPLHRVEGVENWGGWEWFALEGQRLDRDELPQAVRGQLQQRLLAPCLGPRPRPQPGAEPLRQPAHGDLGPQPAAPGIDGGCHPLPAASPTRWSRRSAGTGPATTRGTTTCTSTPVIPRTLATTRAPGRVQPVTDGCERP